MSTDELQNLASNFRLIGIVVTFIGFTVTCVSHVVAERLLASQRADKVITQERLKKSEAELQATKAKTAELAEQLAPRIFTPDQRAALLAFIANTPRGKVAFKCIASSKEASDYCTSLKDFFISAGFIVAPELPMFMSSGYRATGVNMSIRNAERVPPHGGDIQKGFESIGIHVLCSADAEDQSLAEDTVMIYVGAKN